MDRRSFLAKAGKLAAGVGLGGALGSVLPGVASPVPPAVSWKKKSSLLGPSYIMGIDDSGNFYGLNGKTGDIDFADTSPATVLNSILAQLITNGRGGWVHVKAGDYPIDSPVIFNEGDIMLTGEGGGPDFSTATDIQSLPATRFKFTANGQTMFIGTTLKINNILHLKLADFCIDTNGKTGGVGIDLTASNGLSHAGSTIERVFCNNLLPDRTTQNGSFSKAIILDGTADMILRQVTVGLPKGANVAASTTCDVSFDSPGGGLTLEQCILYSSIALQGRWNFLALRSGTYTTLKLTGAPNNYNTTLLSDCYLGPGAATSGTGDTIQANGQALDYIEIERCDIRPGLITVGALTNYVVKLSGGTLDSLVLKGCKLEKFSTNTTSLTDNSANCGRRRALSFASRQSGFTSVAPYTTDVNNYLVDVA